MKILNNVSKKEYIQGIHCDVTNCEYHAKDDHCHARQINVGPGYASNDADTLCGTFKAK